MDKFEALIKEVKSVLNPIGFKQQQNTFYIKQGNNWGLINFQISRSNTKHDIGFTINLEIVSGPIRDFNRGEKVTTVPKLSEDSQWSKRIGFLLPQKNDYWWHIYETTNMDLMQREIKEIILSIAVVEIKRNITDESLINQWLEGRGTGITKFNELLNVAILRKFTGHADYTIAANNLSAYVLGKPIAPVAKKLLEVLDSPTAFPQD